LAPESVTVPLSFLVTAPVSEMTPVSVVAGPAPSSVRAWPLVSRAPVSVQRAGGVVADVDGVGEGEGGVDRGGGGAVRLGDRDAGEAGDALIVEDEGVVVQRVGVRAVEGEGADGAVDAEVDGLGAGDVGVVEEDVGADGGHDGRIPVVVARPEAVAGAAGPEVGGEGRDVEVAHVVEVGRGAGAGGEAELERVGPGVAGEVHLQHGLRRGAALLREGHGQLVGGGEEQLHGVGLRGPRGGIDGERERAAAAEVGIAVEAAAGAAHGDGVRHEAGAVVAAADAALGGGGEVAVFVEGDAEVAAGQAVRGRSSAPPARVFCA
jgi:hypothetical protein